MSRTQLLPTAIIDSSTFKFLSRPFSHFEMVIFIVFSLILSFLFMQTDIIVTTDSAYLLLDGHIADFYDTPGLFTAHYMPTIYYILAIWALPIKLLGLGEIDIIYRALWSKMLLLLALGITIHYIRRIVEHFVPEEDDSDLAYKLFLSSPLVFLAIILMGQYGILALCLGAIGLYHYFQRRYWIFSLLFGVAITIKPFLALAFAPLLLLAAKDLVLILMNGAIFGSLYGLEVLLYRGSPGFQQNVLALGYESRIMTPNFTTFNVAPSIVIILWLFVCAYAFFSKTEERDFFRKANYLALWAHSSFMFFSLWHPQWWIYIVFFSSLLLWRSRVRDGLLLADIVGSIAFFGFVTDFWSTRVDQAMLSHGILKPSGILHAINPSMTDWTTSLAIGIFTPGGPVMLSVVLAVMVVMVVALHPGVAKNFVQMSDSALSRLLIRVRYVVFALLFLVLVGLVTFTYNGELLVDSTDDMGSRKPNQIYIDPHYFQTLPITSERPLLQNLVLPDCTLQMLYTAFINDNQAADASYTIQVIDQRGRVLHTAYLQSEGLTSGFLLPISLGEVKVAKGTYYLLISTSEADPRRCLSVQYVSEISENAPSFLIGNQRIDGSLLMKLKIWR